MLSAAEPENPVTKQISDYALALLDEKDNREAFLSRSTENWKKLVNVIDQIKYLPDDEWTTWCEIPKNNIIDILVGLRD